MTGIAGAADPIEAEGSIPASGSAGGPVPSSVAVVTITEMVRHHLPGVLVIEAANHPRPWSERVFNDELARSGRAYLVARVGPEVVGYAGALMIADDAHVATVSVDPAWQGHGVATRLLVELVRSVVRLGAAQMTLEVRAGNRRAQRLYGRFGFAPAGARKAYYGDNGEDAVVMWAHDVAEPAYEERLRGIEASLPTPTVRHRPTESAPRRSHPAASQP